MSGYVDDFEACDYCRHAAGNHEFDSVVTQGVVMCRGCPGGVCKAVDEPEPKRKIIGTWQPLAPGVKVLQDEFVKLNTQVLEATTRGNALERGMLAWKADYEKADEDRTALTAEVARLKEAQDGEKNGRLYTEAIQLQDMYRKQRDEAWSDKVELKAKIGQLQNDLNAVNADRVKLVQERDQALVHLHSMKGVNDGAMEVQTRLRAERDAEMVRAEQLQRALDAVNEAGSVPEVGELLASAITLAKEASRLVENIGSRE
jgi:hypothetical protein